MWLDLSRVRHAILTPLGEVWIGAHDGSGRTRLVTASSWGAHAADFIPMVFADRLAVPKARDNLEVQPYIVGPHARQRLLIEGTRGKDPKFLDWLVKQYRAPSLAKAFAKNSAEREAEVTTLARSLEKDRSTTGFAVFGADGKLRGIELFANHRLLKEFAPRLLRGYLLEAGEKGIKLAAPTRPRAQPPNS